MRNHLHVISAINHFEVRIPWQIIKKKFIEALVHASVTYVIKVMRMFLLLNVIWSHILENGRFSVISVLSHLPENTH